MVLTLRPLQRIWHTESLVTSNGSTDSIWCIVLQKQPRMALSRVAWDDKRGCGFCGGRLAMKKRALAKEARVIRTDSDAQIVVGDDNNVAKVINSKGVSIRIG
jgi:hypothetical protein